MDPQVLLVVPEVNANALEKITKGIVANPNCSTICFGCGSQAPTRRGAHRRVVVATYQASSGKGPRPCSNWTIRWRAGPWRAPAPRPRTLPSWQATCCPTTGKRARKVIAKKNGRWSTRRGRSWATSLFLNVAHDCSRTGSRRPFRSGKHRIRARSASNRPATSCGRRPE